MRLMFVFLSLLAFTGGATAQVDQKNAGQMTAVMDVVVSDTALLNHAVLEFQMCEPGMHTTWMLPLKSFRQAISVERTRIVIPLPERLAYGRISYTLDGKVVSLEGALPNNNNIFLFENGDSIVLHLDHSPSGASFKGRDSEKYNCLYAIRNQEVPQSALDSLHARHARGRYAYALDAFSKGWERTFRSRLETLRAYRGVIDDGAYRLITADVYGDSYQQLLSTLSMYVRNQSLKRNYFHAVKDLLDTEFARSGLKEEDEILSDSYQYCDFLLQKEILKQRYLIGGPEQANERFDLNKLGQSVKETYSGLVREKLLLMVFSYPSNRRADGAQYLSLIGKAPKINIYRQKLEQAIRRTSPGADTFKLDLADRDGKVHAIHELKDKLVIMDFWFTGCLGCLGMAKALKPIKAMYKDDPRIAFVSVSVDKNKKPWLRSLDEEKYSSLEDLNLWTKGLGEQHPVIPYYNIQSYPRLIVLRNGKLVSAFPPDPRAEQGVAFKQFIKENSQ